MPETKSDAIEWVVHLESARNQVYKTLATDSGRESFWAETATEVDGVIHFTFPNGVGLRSKIIEAKRPEKFTVEYFKGAVSFKLDSDGSGGTDLRLHHEGVDTADYHDTVAGWVSVLMALKASVDHDIDLRNHDPTRTWDYGYVDN